MPYRPCNLSTYMSTLFLERSPSVKIYSTLSLWTFRVQEANGGKEGGGVGGDGDGGSLKEKELFPTAF